jgi:hypothetical protein
MEESVSMEELAEVEVTAEARESAVATVNLPYLSIR